jgi:hypothetical protein
VNLNYQPDEAVSATALARNLATAIDRVRMSRRSLRITKGSQTVAHLSPPPKSGFPVDRLADLLASLPSLGADAANLARDQANIRRNANLPTNPWDL